MGYNLLDSKAVEDCDIHSYMSQSSTAFSLLFNHHFCKDLQSYQLLFDYIATSFVILAVHINKFDWIRFGDLSESVPIELKKFEIRFSALAKSKIQLNDFNMKENRKL